MWRDHNDGLSKLVGIFNFGLEDGPDGFSNIFLSLDWINCEVNENMCLGETYFYSVRFDFFETNPLNPS